MGRSGSCQLQGRGWEGRGGLVAGESYGSKRKQWASGPWLEVVL